MVDSHLIPGFTSLVYLTTVGLSLALHNRVVMELVELTVIETLEMVKMEVMVKVRAAERLLDNVEAEKQFWQVYGVFWSWYNKLPPEDAKEKKEETERRKNERLSNSLADKLADLGRKMHEGQDPFSDHGPSL